MYVFLFGGYFCVVVTFCFVLKFSFLLEVVKKNKSILCRNIYLEIRKGIGKLVNSVIAEGGASLFYTCILLLGYMIWAAASLKVKVYILLYKYECI
jgi:hypothetical protein